MPKPVYNSSLLINLPSEKWKPIPETDELYLISNYGRVKRKERWCETIAGYSILLEERIMATVVTIVKTKHTKRKRYRLHCGVTIEKRKISVSIARIVYCLFVKKFDLLDRAKVIGFKDENSMNVFYKNLIMSSPSFNVSKSYELEYRPRVSFGNKAIFISQYNMQGYRIAVYKSATLAGKESGVSMSHITHQINHEDGFCGGYIWKKGEGPLQLTKIENSVKKKIEWKLTEEKIVTQYSKNGKKIAEFINLKVAASKTKLKREYIKRVCEEKNLSYAGYFWIFGLGPQQLSEERLNEAKKNKIYTLYKPVTQYDVDGKKIAYFKSQAEAARKTGISSYNINGALTGKKDALAGGYFWQYGDGVSNIEISSRIKRSAILKEFYQNAITQYDMNGKRIAFYKTIKDAAKAVNGKIHGFLYLLDGGNRYSFKEYYWLLGRTAAKIDVTPYVTLKNRRPKSNFTSVIIQLTLAGVRINTFETIKAASIATRVSTTGIGCVVRGKYKTANGFLWKREPK